MNVAITIDHHNSDDNDNYIYSNTDTGNLKEQLNRKKSNNTEVISKLQEQIDILNNNIQEQNNRLSKTKEENKELNDVIESYKEHKGNELLQKQLEKKTIEELLQYLEGSLEKVGVSQDKLPMYNEERDNLNNELQNIEVQILKLIDELEQQKTEDT